ncbi:MAG: 16S rRNA (guanine(527)-N(7))-methyltransferase RsmG [Spirochaetaceae bacterium]|nr:16S rRNA (guanine(527)-N(7))-methyltransferase RsmG [Spirochaetaceae bacterium]
MSGSAVDVLEAGLLRLCDGDADAAGALRPRLGVVLDGLERYVAEIEAFNRAYGLVSYRERDELIIRHVLDSLAPLGVVVRALRESAAGARGEAADVGSGAGFPGIPLALALGDVHWTLIERMGRRADFLRYVAALLALKNVSIEQCSVEAAAAAAGAGGGRFDVVAFRAFRPLSPQLVKTLFGLARERGVLAAYKGKAERIRRECAAVECVVGGCRVIPCPVPFLDEERHLLVMNKPASVCAR